MHRANPGLERGLHAAWPYGLLLLAVLQFSACTAVQSTGSALGRNIAGLFSAPAKPSHRTSNPVRPDARLAVLWIGHATVLIQMDDRFILTDPGLRPTSGQFSRRLVEPGIDAADLPAIDVVLISHMHVDHLSFGSLEDIEGKTKQLLLPEGGLVYLPRYAFALEELPRWQSWEQDGLRVTAVPVRHPGWRYGIDDGWMKTSSTGFVIEYHGMTVYFPGDTGYDSLAFRETSRRFPSIDLAMMPIAPNKPREYSGGRHTDPGDALRAFRDLRARWLLPMHFDTFPESYDLPGEASALLRHEIARWNVPPESVILLEVGEQRVLLTRPSEGAAAPSSKEAEVIWRKGGPWSRKAAG